MNQKSTVTVKKTQETFQAILELSKLLDTGLDSGKLSTCVKLCEAGMNPVTLAALVKELQKAVQKAKESTSESSS